MIESLSEKISLRLYELNDKKNVSQAIMKFALISFFTNAISFVLALIIGLIAGTFMDTVISLLAIAVIRTLTGGYHFKSAVHCILVSTIVIAAVPFIPINTNLGFVLTGLACILAIIYAPSGLRGVTRIPESGLQVRKWIAIAIMLTNFYVQSDILSLAFFAQAVTLIHNKGGENR